ncbi:hypothetical protein F511_23235 [Dorcoceras hygrometricum]|uniref:non-specific serine/threonine protein kinase n=1 Tax=Dorcoceras hygrometricum TaxID=472368 RepID=A0A2Z7CP52_9LAMI|nr:hypothetical protein F511_23235 [Dorcoceras hygrometricum]
MEDLRDDAESSGQRVSSTEWWPTDFVENFGSVSLGSVQENMRDKEIVEKENYDRLSYKTASQILWSTGMLSEPLPNGFYSVVPEKKLKELYEDIPTLEELRVLEHEGLRAEVILVDAEKDKKLSMLKQYIVPLVKGLNRNPAAMAGLVSDFYKRPNSELSPKKAAVEDTSYLSVSRGVQMLGHIKHGSCRPRAILFKVLADAVGLESRLVVGLPTEGVSDCVDSYRHMSVLVVLNSVELLVDLMRFPGQLIPRSTKAIFMTHISAAGESDSAENDSCDSPMEPNSPLYGVPEKVDTDSAEKDDGLLYQRRLESSSNAAGPSLRNIMLRSNSIDRKLSMSRSEPNIAATFWRRSRRKIATEQRTASSSPEHPSLPSRGRSMLSGDNKSFRDYSDDIATSRSEGAPVSDSRRIRRRSISMTPEIGDDIVRAVRAMNESLKQNRLLREQGETTSCSLDSNDQHNDSRSKDVTDIGLDDRGKISDRGSSLYTPLIKHSSQAMSLPSSLHEFTSHTSERSGTDRVNEEMVSTWNRVLDLPVFQNKPLLPFEEWNIDFSELTVGTRVGIGFFGEVFRGIWNGTEVAIKVFLEQDLTAENMEDFCNEISILSRLRHPNVILFLGACTKPPQLSMVTEYMEMGSLYYLIHLSGQKKKIIHRDLKTANCLVNKHWTVKICDFGLSKIMTDAPMKDSSSAGTPEWMAPELIRNEPFTEKCDIFSLGVIMWELCTLSRPWNQIPPERVVYAVAHEGSRLEIPEGPLGRLIADCWAEQHLRPSCEEILARLLDCELALC